MGRRTRNNQVADAISAFGQTYGMANTIKDKWGAGNAAESATAVTEDNSGAESDARLRAGYVPGEVKDANGNTVMGEDGKPITNPASYDEFKANTQGLADYTAPKFTMNGQTQATQFTPEQKQTASLSAMRDYYAKSGNVDKVMEIDHTTRRNRYMDNQDQIAGLQLGEAKRVEQQRMKLDSDIADIRSNPQKQAEMIKAAFNANQGRFGEGDYKDASIDYKLNTDGSGGQVWKIDAKGNPIGKPTSFTTQQLEAMAVDTHWRTADPISYAKATEERAARAAEKERLYAEKALDREDRFKIAQMGNDTTLKAANIRAANHGGGLSSADPSKGAKFDTDGDGNRVILYRDGTMTYPKGADGNPVKFKAGTDQDTKFVRGIVQQAEKNRIPVMDEDSVARAQDLARKTKGLPASTPSSPAGIPPGAKQIGTSGGKPVFQSPDGKRYIAD